MSRIFAKRLNAKPTSKFISSFLYTRIFVDFKCQCLLQGMQPIYNNKHQRFSNFLQNEAECSFLENEAECSFLENEAECSFLENEAECSFLENEAERGFLLNHTCILMGFKGAKPIIKKLSDFPLLFLKFATQICSFRWVEGVKLLETYKSTSESTMSFLPPLASSFRGFKGAKPLIARIGYANPRSKLMENLK
ncbi:hypothetical protein CCY99_09120 [Helicobacter sp. 16-1353]|uniref:hypothetical protein n=1 Tax=Helicobacter sp. 16-1353 TaxID=2004996 RepID=UPI000DCDDF94|nr:hypothetical protein [Helicobacter sp. 16-1353]RAX51430.1 hypothetical protein CCY99_09120 [Helicobacter sp. 16-1353]